MSYRDDLDKNPKKILDLLLNDTLRCTGKYAYMMSEKLIDFPKSAEHYDILFSTLYFKISEWLDEVKTSLNNDSYDVAIEVCNNSIDSIASKVKNLDIFNYSQDELNIDYIVKAYTFAILADLCLRHNRYLIGIQMYQQWLSIDTFIDVTHGYSYDEIISKFQQNPKQINATKNKKLLIPLARIIWAKHDVSHIISPSSMADILINLHSRHNEKTPSKRSIKDWLKQYKDFAIPIKVSERLAKDPNYKLDDSESIQLAILTNEILEKYKDSCKEM
ncbi:hypothetical protein [Psychrobacter sanguinis]|uniref:hypothetical protein n=1 Tax=Psychrobacter sanguinis TaxID=861445 RepID=UPI001918FBB8|nr:hypothetical protein [Psychrobacter sanguinis]MCC3307334.1 hypothetical protein [Psychrobacter sanguinis]